MIRWIVVAAMAATAVAAQEAAPASQERPKKPAAQKERPSPAAAEKRLALPKDAVETAPFTWRWTDQEGKRWVYRQTPFGLVRYEDQEREDAAEAAPDGRPQLEAYEEGERVRFERLTPFGKQRWYRVKSELEGEEREAWLRSRKTPETRPSSEKPEKQ